MLRVTLAQIEAFYWTARLGSVRAAAERLNITQPSLSLRLREFGRAVGIAPFRRVGRGLALTAEGAAMMRKVEQIVRLSHEIEPRPGVGEPRLIRVGATDIFAMTVLPDLLQGLDRSHPGLMFDITINFSNPLVEMIEAGQIDIAFVTNPAVGRGFRLQRLAPVTLAWMAPPRLTLPARPLVPADFESIPVFTNPAPSHLSETIRDWFDGAQTAPRRLHTCNTLTVMAHLAATLGGATVLPRAMLEIDPRGRELAALEVVPELKPHQLHAVVGPDVDSSEADAVVTAARTLLARSRHYG
jgi:DNA-binding transcriptional LysR family regulator